jgi:hypothetical protein
MLPRAPTTETPSSQHDVACFIVSAKTVFLLRQARRTRPMKHYGFASQPTQTSSHSPTAQTRSSKSHSVESDCFGVADTNRVGVKRNTAKRERIIADSIANSRPLIGSSLDAPKVATFTLLQKLRRIMAYTAYREAFKMAPRLGRKLNNRVGTGHDRCIKELGSLQNCQHCVSIQTH